MVLPYVDEENLWKFDHKKDKKNFDKKDWERNRRDRQKKLLKKSDLIPFCF